jgi:hypothetical protein
LLFLSFLARFGWGDRAMPAVSLNIPTEKYFTLENMPWGD